jgi:UDP-N-acetylmuramoyl-tripeptide--D-alanyl-D-alanine ligase
MKIKNLIYLAQLEEYNPKRIAMWLEQNPKQEVLEIKKKLIWTPKAELLYLLVFLLSPLLSEERSAVVALKILSPFDFIMKKGLVKIAKIKFRLFNHNVIVIGITGSWGKTTTKEVLFNLLKTKFRVAKTVENQNTILGIAKKIITLPKRTEIFVCEMGAYRLGEIAEICKLVKPKIGIITAIGPMHLERFGTLQNITKAKFELIKSLPPTGLGIIPKKIVTTIPEKYSVKTLKTFNKVNHIYSIISQHFKISPKVLKSALQSKFLTKHRREVVKKGPIIIIDDSYNSNPEGFRLALNDLQKQKTKVKVLVTPGMIELGQYAYQANYQAAKYASKICTHIVIVGKTNKKALESGAQADNKKIKIFCIDDLGKGNTILEEIVIPNETTILYENDLPDNYF